MLRSHAFVAVMRCLDEMSCFLAAEFCCWRADVEGCGRLSVHDGLLDVA